MLNKLLGFCGISHEKVLVHSIVYCERVIAHADSTNTIPRRRRVAVDDEALLQGDSCTHRILLAQSSPNRARYIAPQNVTAHVIEWQQLRETSTVIYCNIPNVIKIKRTEVPVNMIN